MSDPLGLRRLACFGWAALLATAAARGQVPEVDAVLEKWTSSGQITGAVVLVSQDGQLVYHRAIGFADREAKREIKEDAIFRLASMSKPFVSATAMALIDDGKLSLDDPVTKYLPYFTPKLADGTTPTILIRHLLTHTAGLNYGFEEPKNGPYHTLHVLDGAEDPEGLSLEDNLKRLANAPLLFKPGSQWTYSVAIDVLGAVIEKANQSTLPEAVAKYVTGPMGLKDTGFAVTDKARLVTAYAPGDPKTAAPATRMTDHQVVDFGPGGMHFFPARCLDPKAYPSGGAGMVGTASDYLALLEAIRTGGNPILHPETAAAMTQPQTGDVDSSPGMKFGFGFAVSTDYQLSHMRKGSFRWGGVYGGHFWVDPRAKLTVVALTNTALTGTSGPFPQELARAIALRWVVPSGR